MNPVTDLEEVQVITGPGIHFTLITEVFLF